jgi:hypothetical protein
MQDQRIKFSVSKRSGNCWLIMAYILAFLTPNPLGLFNLIIFKAARRITGMFSGALSFRIRESSSRNTTPDSRALGHAVTALTGAAGRPSLCVRAGAGGLARLSGGGCMGVRPIKKAMPRFLRSGLDAEFAFRLVRLWRSWPDVVGEELAELARPMGRRKRTLLLGVEDAMAQQEVSYYAPEIVSRANTFLGQEIFDKVQVDLILGRAPLDTARLPRKAKLPGVGPRPERLGGLEELKREDSAVGRCYRAYLRLYGEEDVAEPGGDASAK